MGVTADDSPTKNAQHGPSVCRQPLATSVAGQRVSMLASWRFRRFRMMLLVEFVMYE